VVRAALLSLAIAALLVACGQVEDGGRDARLPAAVTAADEDVPDDSVAETEAGQPDDSGEPIGGSGGLGFVQTDERPELRDLYAAFARPPNGRDLRAVSHARDWYNEPFDLGRDSLGRVVPTEARVLLEGLGGEEDIVYAVPTEKGYLCIGLAPNGGSSCGGPRPGGFDLAYSYDKDSLVVYGLVGNNVTGVDVLVAARAYAARMGENAYAVRLATTTPEQLRSVVLHYRDQPHETIDLP
jgi:hypothetical protein